MIYMLTGSEILFLKDLINQLVGLADPSEYTLNEIDLAMELLNRLEPVDTEQYLDFMSSLEDSQSEPEELH